MKSFIEVLETLTDEKLTGTIQRNKDFEEVAKSLDSILKPKNSDGILNPDKVCSIVSSDEKVEFAIIGLNPHEDGEVIEREINVWEHLEEYHEPIDMKSENIFNRVLSGGVVPYYRKVAIIINSLLKSRVIMWKEFKDGASNEVMKERYIELIKKHPIAIAELIPFASKNISTIPTKKLEKLMFNDTKIRNYVSKLVDILKLRVQADGWIICNGKNASEAFEMIIKSENYNYEILLNKKETKKYSLYLFEGKKVLLLYHFVRSRGALNSKQQIGEMIDSVCAFNNIPKEEEKWG